MTMSDRFAVLSGGLPAHEREARLASTADQLAERQGVRSLLGNQRFLLAVSGALMTLGVSVILIGWIGAARSTLVQEQIPYLISGGLLGVALAIIGALTLFTHWLTVGIREARIREAERRREHDEVMDALRSISDALARRSRR